jgi:exodeoxyribonuclease VII large subunit
MDFLDDNVYSLKQALETASRAVQQALPDRFWMVGEIAQMSNSRGHYYIELVQKENGMVAAKGSARIWQDSARRILGAFTDATGQTLGSGMNAMMLVTASLHVVYGLSFTVHAVNSEFTLGEMARQKREVITRLTKEGLIDRNKELEFPLAPQRIAVISSQTAAGYGDFEHQLQLNAMGYCFAHTLFEALMQGDQSERSLIAAISQARAQSFGFDVLVVIRGGGSKIDLNCFDSYLVARELATFPLPVITGIGHERDESVVDMVAHQRCKTPTAVAEFLIRCAQEFEEDLLGLRSRIVRAATGRLESCASEIDRGAQRLHSAVTQAVGRRAQQLRVEEEHTRSAVLLRLEREKSILERLSDKTALLDPINVLRRGYSLVYEGDTLVRSVKQTKIGLPLRIRLSDGAVDTQVTQIESKAEADWDAI